MYLRGRETGRDSARRRLRRARRPATPRTPRLHRARSATPNPQYAMMRKNVTLHTRMRPLTRVVFGGVMGLAGVLITGCGGCEDADDEQLMKQELKEKDKDSATTWKSILNHGGSVQHLKFLTDEEKDVFKTFGEISQKEIIIQAGMRQKYIDQGQSLNLMIPPETKPREVNELLIYAWQSGIKSLYYQRSANPAQELARNILNCASCQG